MPIILLGILVILILLVFMYYNGEFGNFAPPGRQKPPKKGEDETENDSDGDEKKVIHLPTDIEKEKKKRHVKTGKN